jgi:hypothetical protein
MSAFTWLFCFMIVAVEKSKIRKIITDNWFGTYLKRIGWKRHNWIVESKQVLIRFDFLTNTKNFSVPYNTSLCVCGLFGS